MTVNHDGHRRAECLAETELFCLAIKYLGPGTMAKTPGATHEHVNIPL